MEDILQWCGVYEGPMPMAGGECWSGMPFWWQHLDMHTQRRLAKPACVIMCDACTGTACTCTLSVPHVVVFR